MQGKGRRLNGPRANPRAFLVFGGRLVWLEAPLVGFPAPLPSVSPPLFGLAPPLVCPPLVPAPNIDPFQFEGSDCPPPGVCPFLRSFFSSFTSPSLLTSSTAAYD